MVLLLALAGGLCGGCVSFEPAKFENQVQHWVPPGTPEKEAEHIMTHHGFECSLIKQDNRFNQHGFDYLDCTRTQVWFHDWNVQIYMKDGKVSGYGPARVE